MLETVALDGPVDLAVLDQFLASDDAPPDCMQLSELDGFLAGIVAGPQVILPSVWLPMVWREENGPVFPDSSAARDILGNILRRYNEIGDLLDTPGAYRPVLVEQGDGTIDPSDWALGFIQAMALCEDGWEPLVCDKIVGAVIVPVMLFASMTDKANLPLDIDERPSEKEMAALVAGAGAILSMCVSAARGFFRQPRPTRRKRSGASARKRR
jgi:uncharacterized protein